MALSDKALQELEAERRRLLGQRKDIDEALAGIEALLRLRERVPSPNGSDTVIHIAELGLRDAIRAALRGHPHGRKPREVTEHLRSANYTYDGKTGFGLRVSNELHRMAQGDSVERAGYGRYRLTNST